MLKPFVKMSSGNLVREITIRFGLELIHHNSKHAPALLTRPATRRLHDSKVTARADNKTRFGQQLAHTMRLRILRISLSATRPAEDCYDAFLSLRHKFVNRKS